MPNVTEPLSGFFASHLLVITINNSLLFKARAPVCMGDAPGSRMIRVRRVSAGHSEHAFTRKPPWNLPEPQHCNVKYVHSHFAEL